MVDPSAPTRQKVGEGNDFLNANDAWMDAAMKRDLSKTQTLVDIRDHVLEFTDCEKELAEVKESFEKWNVKPIWDDVGLLFGSDGKPAIQLVSLWHNCEKEGKEFGWCHDNIWWFSCNADGDPIQRCSFLPKCRGRCPFVA